jgi:oxygen-independent coproporphyrinogen-3 oxidase
VKAKKLGLYAHIPFCARKCRYCDFRSFPIADPDIHREYARKLVFEIACKTKLFRETHEADTIYIGGGTPSLIAPELIAEVLDAFYANYAVADDAEITVEVNPGTVSLEAFRAYRASGVNRISVGVQSFDQRMLDFLGRVHTPQEAAQGLAWAEKSGFDNVNLDLIFGIPGQSLALWERDLKTALETEPAHLSFYSLQIEDGTPLYDDFVNGKVEEADEIEDRRMYHSAKNTLSAAGYAHYEISNSAKPGRASRHNLKYWSMEDYAGFGVAAHSYVNGHRFSNTNAFAEYISAPDAPEMIEWVHRNTASEEMSEYIFLGLRRTAGIDLSHFQGAFGRDFWELYGVETQGLIGRGLLERTGDVLRLTALGLDLANNVFREYV